MGRSWALGRKETTRPNKGNGGIHAGDQPDVRELRHAFDKNDVRRFYITMRQSVPVQMLKRGGERDGNAQTLVERQAISPVQLQFKRPRHVMVWIQRRLATTPVVPHRAAFLS